MAELPIGSANGKMILKIYNDFNVRPGEVLASNNFVAWATRNRVRMDDLRSGLDYAVQEGWITEKSNGFLALTETGFHMI